MDTKVTATRDAAWDELALDVMGTEFSLNDLMRAQVVESFTSPVYNFIVPEGSSITAPQTLEVVEETFKAPWE